MHTAQSKRKENIAEYILYIWQIEDLLRALQLSPEAIYSQLVQSRDMDDDQKQEIFFWYMSITNLLKEENKIDNGHLDHTLHIIADLQNLHNQLMRLPVGENYRKLYSGAATEISTLKGKLQKPDISDVELFFRALYSVILLRIKGDNKNDKYIEDVLTIISPVVSELATMFHKIERGEVDLFKEQQK